MVTVRPRCLAIVQRERSLHRAQMASGKRATFEAGEIFADSPAGQTTRRSAKRMSNTSLAKRPQLRDGQGLHRIVTPLLRSWETRGLALSGRSATRPVALFAGSWLWRLRLEERAEHRGPPSLEVGFPLESAL